MIWLRWFALAGAATGILAMGCTEPNPDFCEEAPTMSCSDLDGDGSVIPDAAPDAQVCTNNRDCDEPGASFCDRDEGVCRGCSPPGGPAMECAEIDPDRPDCSSSGRCVECASSGSCQEPLQPICDPDENTCRACDNDDECTAPGAPVCAPDGACVECVDHADCDSEVCDPESRTCVSGGAVVYVGGSGATDAPTCGTELQPCASIQYAVDNILAPNRPAIRIRPGSYDSVVFDDVEALVIGAEGQTTVLRGSASDTPVVTADNGAEVLLAGLVVRGAFGSGTADGVGCTGSATTVRMHDVAIRDNDSAGIRVTNCTARAVDCVIEENSGVGIMVQSSGTLRLDRSRVLTNQGGGVQVQSSAFSIVNSLITNNGSDGSQVGGVRIINLQSFDPQRFAFNTVADNEAGDGSPAYGIGCEVSDASNAVFESNVVWGGEGPSDALWGNCSFSYSNIENGPAGSGNIDQPPLFEGGGDYHLRSGSPCIDVGTPLDGVLVDIDSDLRDPAPDMGADERVD